MNSFNNKAHWTFSPTHYFKESKLEANPKGKNTSHKLFQCARCGCVKVLNKDTYKQYFIHNKTGEESLESPDCLFDRKLVERMKQHNVPIPEEYYHELNRHKNIWNE